MKESQNYDIQRSHFMKLEFGIENYLTVITQTLLVLLSTTETGTTRGFESLFDRKTTFLGIEMKPETILILSIAISLKSCFMTHVKVLTKEKGFMPIVPKLIVIIWTMFGALRRVLSIVAFFIPSLGLFSILYHIKWEQIPYESRMIYAKENTIKDSDKIHLHGLTENISWSELDHFDYTDPNDPTPPSYVLYTGLDLQQSFIAFFCILFLQFITIFVVKCFTARQFRSMNNKFRKIMHVALNSNFGFPYKDWDANVDGPCSKEDYQRQYR